MDSQQKEYEKIGKDLDTAASILTSGGLVSIPTETVYGLAANALNQYAVAKIFTAKNRPEFDPLIIHVSDIEQISKYTEKIDERLQILANQFMPGPLTLLLNKKEIISDLVTAGLPRVAIRIPDHPLTKELLSMLDFPLAAPSANPFGYISPTSAAHVFRQLENQVDYILDGGECQVGVESTIIGIEDQEITVYRKGGLAIEEIEKLVGPVIVKDHSESNPGAPGMLKSHYSPGKRMTLTTMEADPIIPIGKNIGCLRFKNYMGGIDEKNQLILSPKGNYEEAARNLFAYMRLLDEKEVDEIIAELLPEEGLGRAINDRLRRAATKC